MYKAVVKLEGYGVGGYVWTIEPTDDITVLSENFVMKDTDVVGGGSTVIFTLVSTKKGKQKVKAIRKRPWESTDADEVKELELNFE